MDINNKEMINPSINNSYFSIDSKKISNIEHNSSSPNKFMQN